MTVKTPPARHPVHSSARVLAIANQKGGVGKTTTAVNLSAALGKLGRKVLLVDLDPQGNASTGLGLVGPERGPDSYRILTEDLPPAGAARPAPGGGFDLIPASPELAGLDAELAQAEDRAHRLTRALRAGGSASVVSSYDYIFIDCPPSLNLLTVNAMAAADRVLVPLQCEFFALEGLTQLLATVKRVRGGLNPGLAVEGIVLTMYDRRNNLSAQVAQDVRRNLGDAVFQTIIPRNVRLSEAPSHALSGLDYDPHCAGSVAYRALAAELLAREERRRAA